MLVFRSMSQLMIIQLLRDGIARVMRLGIQQQMGEEPSVVNRGPWTPLLCVNLLPRSSPSFLLRCLVQRPVP